MTQPKPDLILANVISTLQTITAANGYRSTVVKVEEGHRPPSEVPPSERPYIGVIDGEERPTAEGGRFKNEFDIGLVCYVHDDGVTSAKTQLANLRWDIRKALEVDPYRGINPDDATQRNAINTKLVLWHRDRVPDSLERRLILGITCDYLEERAE